MSRGASVAQRVMVAMLLGAGCGTLESDEARDVARTTKQTVNRGIDGAKEQLDKVDLDKVRAGWDAAITAADPRTRPPTAGAPSEPAADPLADVATAIACEASGERCTVSADFASRARQHGSTVARQVRVSAAQGGARGIRIDAIDAGTIAERVGLQAGDVVTHVNGTALGSPQDAMLLYMSVRAAQRFVVDYRRGDEERSLQVDVVQ